MKQTFRPPPESGVRARRRRARVHWVVAAATLAALFCAAGSEAARSDATTAADVAFAQATPDAQALEIFTASGVTPRALYMRAGALRGTYRTYRERPAQASLERARAQAVRQFAAGLEGNLERLRRFVEMHTLADVLASDRLVRQGRSLLRIRSELHDALVRTSRGDALVLGAEVTGDAEQLEALRRDRRVAAFRLASERRTKPLPLESRQSDPAATRTIDGLSAAAVYRQIEALVGGNR